ncbi:hypothetical protein ABZX12_26310 [Kribbella sp. NPDC003505]|uniref:hypothetical protein n=1 Tax=Kribbella sp. NPDC003505 TaxID=3154448 RepID=UPI0033A4E032
MARRVLCVAGVLYVGIAILLFKGPEFTIEDDGEGAVHVDCASLITVGWPSDHSSLDTEATNSWADHVRTDRNIGTPGRLGIARDCSERRDTYLAFVVIAAIAANLATLVATTIGRTSHRKVLVSD